MLHITRVTLLGQAPGIKDRQWVSTPIGVEYPRRMTPRKTPGYYECTQAGKSPYNWSHGGDWAHYRHS